jgi:hypothetical protein
VLYLLQQRSLIQKHISMKPVFCCRCHPWTGECDCKPGWDGKMCSRTCPFYTYGKGCHNTCNCKNDAQCSPVNGTCICAAGMQMTDSVLKFKRIGLGVCCIVVWGWQGPRILIPCVRKCINSSGRFYIYLRSHLNFPPGGSTSIYGNGHNDL